MIEGLSEDWAGGVGRGFAVWLAAEDLGSNIMSFCLGMCPHTYQWQLHLAVSCEGWSDCLYVVSHIWVLHVFLSDLQDLEGTEVVRPPGQPRNVHLEVHPAHGQREVNVAAWEESILGRRHLADIARGRSTGCGDCPVSGRV